MAEEKIENIKAVLIDGDLHFFNVNGFLANSPNNLTITEQNPKPSSYYTQADVERFGMSVFVNPEDKTIRVGEKGTVEVPKNIMKGLTDILQGKGLQEGPFRSKTREENEIAEQGARGTSYRSVAAGRTEVNKSNEIINYLNYTLIPNVPFSERVDLTEKIRPEANERINEASKALMRDPVKQAHLLSILTGEKPFDTPLTQKDYENERALKLAYQKGGWPEVQKTLKALEQQNSERAKL